jgi:hypothetical protein
MNGQKEVRAAVSGRLTFKTMRAFTIMAANYLSHLTIDATAWKFVCDNRGYLDSLTDLCTAEHLKTPPPGLILAELKRRSTMPRSMRRDEKSAKLCLAAANSLGLICNEWMTLLAAKAGEALFADMTIRLRADIERIRKEGPKK